MDALVLFYVIAGLALCFSLYVAWRQDMEIPYGYRFLKDKVNVNEREALEAVKESEERMMVLLKSQADAYMKREKDLILLQEQLQTVAQALDLETKRRMERPPPGPLTKVVHIYHHPAEHEDKRPPSGVREAVKTAAKAARQGVLR